MERRRRLPIDNSMMRIMSIVSASIAAQFCYRTLDIIHSIYNICTMVKIKRHDDDTDRWAEMS